MANLSDINRLTTFFIRTDQVPTQSLMKENMNAKLAAIYFKAMTPNLQVLAGLEPPMKRNRGHWFVPPKELLQGKTVLKRIRTQSLVQLSWNGIDNIGFNLLKLHFKLLKKEIDERLRENNIFWKETIEDAHYQQLEKCTKEEIENNTETIKRAFDEFTSVYSTSLTNMEAVLLQAAREEIIKIRRELFQKMQVRYEALLKNQSTSLYKAYDREITEIKTNLKSGYIEKSNRISEKNAIQMHDINVEKYVAIEKCRQFLECQKLACQIYTALKEQECFRDVQQAKYEQKEAITKCNDEIVMKDFEIMLAKQKEIKKMQPNSMWQNKMCHVVKKFQKLVTFCLRTIPSHADFFINLEKLLLVQFSEAFENPSVESIYKADVELSPTSSPEPHPFYLFCDQSCTPQINTDLCPKHCTSSASQLPVIVINKRCVYAACDNFEQFTDQIQGYIHRNQVDEDDFDDYPDYSRNVPLKYTASQQLFELKLESSLMQVLQQEIANIKKVDVICAGCNIRNCVGCFRSSSSRSCIMPSHLTMQYKQLSLVSKTPFNILPRDADRKYARQRNQENYLRYIRPKACKCAKAATESLEHLPAYMKQMSYYNMPEIPSYEFCSPQKLKVMVKQAKILSRPQAVPIKLRVVDASTQISDEEFDSLCSCFSDKGLHKFRKTMMADSKEIHFQVGDGTLFPTFMGRNLSSFANDRMKSLLNIIGESN